MFNTLKKEIIVVFKNDGTDFSKHIGLFNQKYGKVYGTHDCVIEEVPMKMIGVYGYFWKIRKLIKDLKCFQFKEDPIFCFPMETELDKRLMIKEFK